MNTSKNNLKLKNESKIIKNCEKVISISFSLNRLLKLIYFDVVEHRTKIKLT
jgi:hypothetical protein